MNAKVNSELETARALMTSETPWTAFPHLYAALNACRSDDISERAEATTTLREFENGASYLTLLREAQRLHSVHDSENRHRIFKLLDMALSRCEHPSVARDEVLRARADILVRQARAAYSARTDATFTRLRYIGALKAAEEMSTGDPELIKEIELSILGHSDYYMYCGTDVPVDITQRRTAFRLGLKHGHHERVRLAVDGLMLLYGRDGTIATEAVAMYRECAAAYNRASEISRDSFSYLELLADWSMLMNEFELAAHLYERLATAHEALTWPWNGLNQHPWDLFNSPSLRLREAEANLRLFSRTSKPLPLDGARATLENALGYMENGYMDAWDKMFDWMLRHSPSSPPSRENELRKARRQTDNLRRAIEALETRSRLEEAQRSLGKVITFFARTYSTCPWRKFLSEYNTDGQWHMALRDQQHLAPPPFSFDDELTDLVTANHEERRRDRKPGEDRIATKLKSAFTWLKSIDRGTRFGNAFHWAQIEVDEALEICHARMFGACLLAAWLASERRSHKDIVRAQQLLEEARRHKQRSGDSWKEQQNRAFSLVVRRHQRNKKLASEHGSYSPKHSC